MEEMGESQAYNKPQNLKKQRSYKLTSFLLMLPGIITFIILFAYPMIYTVIMSFQSREGLKGFTLENYIQYFSTGEAFKILKLSFILAIVPTVLIIFLSVPFCLLIRKKFKGNRFYKLLMILPMMVPSLISTLGLLIFFNSTGWFNLFLTNILRFSEPIKINYTMLGLIIFYVWLHFPFTAISVLSTVEGLDRGAEEAAQVCGASPMKVLWHVTLPLIMPGIISGSIMTFLLCFGTFSVPLIAGGDYRPIAVQVYTQTAVFNNWNKGSALAVIMSIVQVVFLVIYMKLTKRREIK